MHQMGYVHCDIKPNNILRNDKGEVKVIDFGQSCKIGTVKERIQGTPDYIAPEQVARRPITVQTDVFNLGATLYWALTGKAHPDALHGQQEGREQLPARHPHRDADRAEPEGPAGGVEPGHGVRLHQASKRAGRHGPDDQPPGAGQAHPRQAARPGGRSGIDPADHRRNPDGFA